MAGANKAFAKLGVTVSFKVKGSQAYDIPSSTVQSAESEHQVVGTPPLSFNNEWTSKLLTVGDAYIMVKADTVTFEMASGSEVKIGGAWFTVFGFEPLTVGSTVIAYIVKLRG